MAALAEDCTPDFFVHLPRDHDWFYGTAKSDNPQSAREDALRNLGKQVSGDLAGWSDSDINAIAGPGYERAGVADEVGRLLPASSLLAGWEQDDGRLCQGSYFALVRIEKTRVRKYLTDNQTFRNDLLAALARRIGQIENKLENLESKSRTEQATVAEHSQKISNLTGRLAALEERYARLTARQDLAKKDADLIKRQESARHHLDEIRRKLTAAESNNNEILPELSTAEGSLDTMRARLVALVEKHVGAGQRDNRSARLSAAIEEFRTAKELMRELESDQTHSFVLDDLVTWHNMTKYAIDTGLEYALEKRAEVHARQPIEFEDLVAWSSTPSGEEKYAAWLGAYSGKIVHWKATLASGYQPYLSDANISTGLTMIVSTTKGPRILSVGGLPKDQSQRERVLQALDSAAGTPVEVIGSIEGVNTSGEASFPLNKIDPPSVAVRAVFIAGIKVAQD